MEFGDYVALGTELVKDRDNNAWQLGDLARDFMQNFEVKQGRPVDQNAPTLSDLAGAWDVEIQRVSEWHKVAAFYPDNNLRMSGVSWSHHNMARRASDDVEEALELLRIAQEQHFSVAAFRRYLNGILYEGEADPRELPARLYQFLPDGTRTVWLVIKKTGEAEA